MFKFKSSQKT